MQQLFNVGKIVNTHGIRGELKILTTTDFPEDRFAKGSELLIVPAEGKAPIPVTIETARFQKIWLSLNLRNITISMKLKNIKVLC